MRKESPRFEACTAVAPRVRPSSAAIRSPGTLPAMAFSLAMSSSFHRRLDLGIRNAPFKNTSNPKFTKSSHAASLHEKAPPKMAGAEFACSTVMSGQDATFIPLFPDLAENAPNKTGCCTPRSEA